MSSGSSDEEVPQLEKLKVVLNKNRKMSHSPSEEALVRDSKKEQRKKKGKPIVIVTGEKKHNGRQKKSKTTKPWKTTNEYRPVVRVRKNVPFDEFYLRSQKSSKTGSKSGSSKYSASSGVPPLQKFSFHEGRTGKKTSKHKPSVVNKGYGV